SGMSKSLLFTLQQLGVPTCFCVCDHWVARSAESDVWLSWWNRKNLSLRQRLFRQAWIWTGFRRRCQALAPTRSARELRFPRLHFCSHSVRDFTVESGFDVKHAAIIYVPVNTQRFWGEPKPVETPMRRLLYVGRLHEDKGVMTALRAML